MGLHVYLAAVYTNNYMQGQKLYEALTDTEKEITHNLPHILESWHYVGKQRYVDDMRRNAARIFLDSGAFSAYTLGVELSVAEYCEYIQRNMDIIRVEDGSVMASVLDGIGDPLQTYRNQLEMEQRGVRPLPCFHAGEDERYLEWYIQNYEYITLGGMVGTSTKQLMVWLDRVWGKYLTDGAGRAKIKVHGFGITSTPIMERYPWYSCDSSSWIQSTSFGVIVTPQFGPLSISDKSPSRHDAGQHISTLTPIEQEVVFQHLESIGFTYERLSTIYQSRAAYNLWAYGMINALINASKDDVFRNRVQELF
jgi:hypothetical protein